MCLVELRDSMVDQPDRHQLSRLINGYHSETSRLLVDPVNQWEAGCLVAQLFGAYMYIQNICGRAREKRDLRDKYIEN